MGIFIHTMELIVTIITVAGFIYWIRRKKTLPQEPIDTGTIHIVVENGAANKEKATERSAIVHEAEILFSSLQKKYLYSPLPFKVLGDFYIQKGLEDKALEKYSQMIRYLNADLSLEKLGEAVAFMRSHGAEDTASAVEAFYKQGGT